MNKKVIYITTGIFVVVGLSVGWYVYRQFSQHSDALKVSQDHRSEMILEMVEQKVEDIESKVFEISNPIDSQAENQKSQVQKSEFVGADFIHTATGEAVVTTLPDGALLTFTNFKVVAGPDLFVYLSKEPISKQGDELGEFVNLGKLQSHKGEQSYVLPPNYMDYKTIVVWCRAFGVLFASAQLE